MKRRLGIIVAGLLTLSMMGGAAPVAASADEGCTPGYWKNHTDMWPITVNGWLAATEPAGVQIRPSDDWDDWFSNDLFDMTLLEVLQQGGGGKYAFGRHAVAAFLNAHSDGVQYDRYPGSPWGYPNGVWNAVDRIGTGASKAAYNAAKSIFEGLNESGCPL